MSSDLYSSRVLELAADIPHIGRLDAPDGHAHKVSRLCGSEITLDVMLRGDTVVACAIEPKACALGQAAASVLTRHIVGASADEIIRARDQFRAMLKDKGPPPEGRFWELRYLQDVADYPPRHTSALLAFEAAVTAVDMALKKQKDLA
ncbi:MAG: hypothetical protein RL186_1803 [Pseudomonadota bacterium]|jgi:NifU-like protein involved in Fe-S cluster formation